MYPHVNTGGRGSERILLNGPKIGSPRERKILQGCHYSFPLVRWRDGFGETVIIKRASKWPRSRISNLMGIFRMSSCRVQISVTILTRTRHGKLSHGPWAAHAWHTRLDRARVLLWPPCRLLSDLQWLAFVLMCESHAPSSRTSTNGPQVAF